MDNIHESLKGLAIDIDKVEADPRNANNHPERNIEAIMKSLEVYGQRKPIVIRRKTMTVTAGNGMFEAAQRLGWDQIAVLLVDESQEMATGFAIMDNQSARLSDWNMTALKDLLEELDSANWDMDATGFTPEEIEDMMTAAPPAEEQSDGDGGGGLGNPVVQYTIIFDDEQQQDKWFGFIKHLKSLYPDAETIAYRLQMYIDSLDIGALEEDVDGED